MLAPGDLIDVTVEKPASGGRMIARHDGEVVLISGAIPGERLRARVTRAEKRVAFADAVSVIEQSPDRRELGGDPACGGCTFAHIAYPRQVRLKAEIIEDTFVRIGRIPLPQHVNIRSAAEHGYRMKARFHIRNGRAGFYREGTHETCDPRQTRQVPADAIDAVDAAVETLAAEGVTCLSAELSENIAADQRALHASVSPSPSLDRALSRAVQEARLHGITARTTDGFAAIAGDPIVIDTLSALSGGRASAGVLRRHPESFFQGNRFLIGPLVGDVIDRVPDGRVLDLYAGVGLFAAALAAVGRREITAVEGDQVSGRDLERNAAPFAEHLRVARISVEAFLLHGSSEPPHTMIVDPPRTGMSKEAAQAIARARAPRIIYVSCDAPTMARDARRLLDAGYRLTSLEGFDLFPNTPHVESVGVFDL